MATGTREVKRLREKLRARQDAFRRQGVLLRAATQQLLQFRADNAELRQQVTTERLMRVSAQRSLVEDIRTPCYECGKPWRPPGQRVIGYDPDQDRVVQRDIAAGLIPPSHTATVRRQAVQATVPPPAPIVNTKDNPFRHPPERKPKQRSPLNRAARRASSKRRHA